MASSKQQAEELRLQGNERMGKREYKEAIELYTLAIKLDPREHTLYSNRSLAFLSCNQLWYALRDAERAIALQPQWAKAYYRRGEVEFAAGHYSDAMLSFQMAFFLQPADGSVLVALNKTRVALESFQKREKRDPWLFTAVGLIFGALIALADWTLAPSPSLKHPVLIVLLTLTTSVCGYGAGKAFRFFLKTQREGVLQPPNDILPGFDEQLDKKQAAASAEKKPEKPHVKHHYSKAAARRRYQIGKGP